MEEQAQSEYKKSIEQKNRTVVQDETPLASHDVGGINLANRRAKQKMRGHEEHSAEVV